MLTVSKYLQLVLLALAYSFHLSALQSPLSSVSGPEKLPLCSLPPRFVFVGVRGVRREVRESDGKQVVFNQSGRETGSHRCPFGRSMKVVSMPSGIRVPPFLLPMAEGRGRGRKLHMVMGEGCCK